MLSDLKAARLAETQALMSLITQGQEVRRVLSELIDQPHLPPALRTRALLAVKQHLAASRRYAQASAARAIARQRPAVSHGRRSTPPTRRASEGRRSDHVGTEPQTG